jgi:hypothetical protein
VKIENIETIIVSPEEDFNGNLFNTLSDDSSGISAYLALKNLQQDWIDNENDFSYIEASILETIENLNGWLATFRATIRSQQLIQESLQKAMDNDFSSAQELLILAKEYCEGFKKEELEFTRKFITGESAELKQEEEKDDLPNFEE